MTGTRANSSRERILATAESPILDRGFAGTTIEDIADKAAFAKSGFSIIFTCCFWMVSRCRPISATAATGGVPPRSLIRAA